MLTKEDFKNQAEVIYPDITFIWIMLPVSLQSKWPDNPVFNFGFLGFVSSIIKEQVDPKIPKYFYR